MGQGLTEAVAGLSQFPGRHPLVREEEEFERPCRCCMYHSHRIIYGIDDARKEIIILRIYHGARRSLTQSDILPEN
jgi:plasmid stabilization system protein ParE